MAARIKKAVDRQCVPLLWFAARRGRVEGFLSRRLRSVERRIERRLGSLAVSASRPIVLLAPFSVLGHLAGRRHCVVWLRDLTGESEGVEALARQIRREAVRRGSGRCEMSPHRMSHGRHVRPGERTTGE